MFLNGALVIPKQVMNLREGPQLGSGVRTQWYKTSPFHLAYRCFLNGALVIPKQVMDLIEGPQLGSGVLGSTV